MAYNCRELLHGAIYLRAMVSLSIFYLQYYKLLLFFIRVVRMTNCLYALPKPEVKVKQSTNNKSLSGSVFEIVSVVQKGGVNEH